MGKKMGSIIKKARENAGLTQEELAEKIGINVSYLSKLERGIEGNPTKEILKALHELLKIDLKDLFVD